MHNRNAAIGTQRGGSLDSYPPSYSSSPYSPSSYSASTSPSSTAMTSPSPMSSVAFGVTTSWSTAFTSSLLTQLRKPEGLGRLGDSRRRAHRRRRLVRHRADGRGQVVGRADDPLGHLAAGVRQLGRDLRLCHPLEHRRVVARRHDEDLVVEVDEGEP